ncbi:Na+-driven multidrug efflux pump [Geothermobacter ehrlichii]|uniref:Na+-driven multidrug efflux pump n=1 Tax=Geothermobacter ehrlichii TaxID=213224 RepID=A0A5D3WLF0_9BACT|nr:hypothetical protein [Geothermobacter ehrlichii]TYO98954.1 Na+-driven multidrug efflux pump [Geothermobacter ehrlichii]
MTRTRLGQKEIALFFFPLLLNVQLMSVSHTVINGGLARLEDYVTALAGFSVAMVVHLFVASPSYQNHTVTIAMVRGRRSWRGVLLFVLLVAAYVAAMLGLMAFTPVGIWVLERLLGAPPEVVKEARRALGILFILPFFTGLRGFCQGLVIRARRTGLVSLATGVRVGGLFMLLAWGDDHFSGAALGAFALVGCVIIETLVMIFLAWRIHQPLPADDAEESTGAILRYAFPLAWSSCLQQTIPLLINAILGRLPDAAMALAAFGVIRGLLFLLAGPMRNLQQAYLTLVRQDDDYRALVRFHFRVASGMGLLLLVVAGPLSQPVLGDLLGVAPDLRRYLAPALACCAVFPLLYGGSNLLRGWFAGARRTGQLGRSTLVKCLFMLLCWPLLTRWPLPVTGILVGILLLLAAEGVELSYLRLQRQKLPPELQQLVPR